MTEAAFLALLRSLPLHIGAQGLLDDAAAVVPPVGRALVFTHDVVAEGVHFLATDPPGDVAWKLVAVNLSDLAAKGAVPLGVMLGYPLGDDGWNHGFVEGLREVLTAYDVPLIGGDTVRAPRVLGLTAIGHAAPGAVPVRTAARAGDALWVTGTIGDAGLGLALAQQGGHDGSPLVRAYRRPQPRLAEGQALAASGVRAMMDVSDGLLIDAARMAAASGLGVTIDLAAVPLSEAAAAFGTDRAARLRAATAGDDYELLFAMPDRQVPVVPATRVGRFADGEGLVLTEGAEVVEVPPRLGWEHG